MISIHYNGSQMANLFSVKFNNHFCFVFISLAVEPGGNFVVKLHHTKCVYVRACCVVIICPEGSSTFN